MKNSGCATMNNQDPPVSFACIEAVGLTWYGKGIQDKTGLFLGDFDSAKWVFSERGPAIQIGVRIFDYPIRHAAPTPLDMVRSEYFSCVWSGCDCRRCRVEQTQHVRRMPVLFYVRCPECGARGPERWERSEAIREWERGRG